MTEQTNDELWWDAHVHIARYSAPLVLKLLENCNGYPGTLNSVEEWMAELKLIHDALVYIATDGCFDSNGLHDFCLLYTSPSPRD